MHFIRVNNDVRGQKGDVSNITFAQGEAKLCSKDLKKAQNDAQVAAEVATQEKLLKTGDSKKQRDRGILTPISFRKNVFGKTPASQTENGSPISFPDSPISFHCEHKPANTAHSKSRNLDQKREKDLPNVSTHFFSVWKPGRGPYPTLSDLSGTPSLISLGYELTPQRRTGVAKTESQAHIKIPVICSILGGLVEVCTLPLTHVLHTSQTGYSDLPTF